MGSRNSRTAEEKGRKVGEKRGRCREGRKKGRRNIPETSPNPLLSTA